MATSAPSGTWLFPPVTGRDLRGTELSLPAQFPARLTVAILAFQQSHQGQVDAWIARLGEAGVPTTPLGQEGLDRVVLELPVLSGRYQIVRRFIDGGMAASIKVPEVLARTITVYGSVDGVCRPLGIDTRDTVSVRVVRRDGSVAWGTTGQVAEPLVEELLAALDAAEG